MKTKHTDITRSRYTHKDTNTSPCVSKGETPPYVFVLRGKQPEYLPTDTMYLQTDARANASHSAHCNRR